MKNLILLACAVAFVGCSGEKQTEKPETIADRVLNVKVTTAVEQTFEEQIAEADAIVVGGGNTLNMLGIWQAQGIFARKRALRELRERAGFRLESHRIGNYVAKTFDLMNEAQVRFARAQQALFAADFRYKIKPEIHAGIYRICRH